MNEVILNLIKSYLPEYSEPKKESSSGIYIIMFNKSNKFYIGSCKNFKDRISRHTRELEKGKNMCGSLQNHYNENPFFYAELIEHIDLPWNKKAFFGREEFWLKTLIVSADCLNLTSQASGGDTISNNPNRNKIIKSISDGLNSGISKLSPEEYAERFHKGKPNPIANPKKFSETMKKIKAGEKHHFYGKHLTDEHKTKLKISCQGSKQPHAVRCEIDGVFYNTLAEAERCTGVGRKLIKFRCVSKSTRFSNWKLVA